MTIPAKVTQISFPIMIMNDRILEGNEKFILIINSSSLPNYISKFGQATVTILDDDGKSLFALLHIYVY